MEVAAAILIGSLIYTLTNTWKLVQTQNWPSVVNQVIAYGVGIAVVFLAGEAAATGAYEINGTALSDYDTASKLMFGLLASSLFGAFNDLTASIDNTRSSGKTTITKG